MNLGLPVEVLTDKEPGDRPVSDGDADFVTVLRAGSGWELIDFHKLWQFRELAYVLSMRDFKVRYKQAVVGAAWAILQPLAMMAVFTAFFRMLGATPLSENFPYPYAVFVFSGLLPWQMFSSALKGSSESLVLHQDLIKKVYFPRIILPAVPIATAVLDFLIAFSLLIVMMFYYQITPGWNVLFLPFFVLLAAVTALAFGLWLSAANALYRDIRHAVPFLIQIWFYLTPVVYDRSLIQPRFQNFYALNPMVGVVEGFRWSLLGGEQPPVILMMISTISVAVLLIAGIFYFRRMERIFVDWI